MTERIPPTTADQALDQRIRAVLDEQRRRRQQGRLRYANQRSGDPGRPLEPVPVNKDPIPEIWIDLPGPDDENPDPTVAARKRAVLEERRRRRERAAQGHD